MANGGVFSSPASESSSESAWAYSKECRVKKVVLGTGVWHALSTMTFIRWGGGAVSPGRCGTTIGEDDGGDGDGRVQDWETFNGLLEDPREEGERGVGAVGTADGFWGVSSDMSSGRS